MIEITQAMIGPADPVASIEEEYAQALPRVRFLLEAFRGHDPSNNTAHGRMVYQLRWLERELVARRVPIPLDRRWIGTLCYLVGSGEVDDSKEIATSMGELTRILQGPGLLKPRHTPVVLSMLDDLIAAMRRYGDPLLLSEQELVEELSAVAAGMRAGAIIPPIGGGMNLPPLKKKMLEAKRFKGVFPAHPSPENYLQVFFNLSKPLFGGWCPYPAKKPPLSAPVPGLDPSPPDFTAVKRLLDGAA
ncbi:hypothetical protein ACOSOMT5_P0395 [Acidiphilium sp. MT5]